ncbi:MAG TPA: NnrS family protein [Nitrospira sp.]|nr:NnrS family protein [Nitrospira sp.]
MTAKPIEIRVSQPTVAADESTFPSYGGPPLFSWGFRPFFLGAALFAALAVPVWILIAAGAIAPDFLYPPREWHIHEMLFGFLPAVMAGFILTAMPNWTGRMPVRGTFLISLWLLWLAGRLIVGMPGPVPVLAAVVDTAFLITLAAVVWHEIAAARRWDRSPIGVLITVYAGANIVFDVLALRGASTDLAERAALSVLLLLLTVIGGRVTPAFTAEYLTEQRSTARPAAFSRFDGLSMLLVFAAALAWIVQPEGAAAGALFIFAGIANLLRVSRWRGWLAWGEPLVLMLSIGYGWSALSLLALGGAAFALVPAANAVHVLTSGAVGSMTLAIMTRASLGHTGRPRHADFMTLVIYVLVNLGAILRVAAPASATGSGMTILWLGIAALAWSGAYLLFALVYGPMLIRPSLDE